MLAIVDSVKGQLQQMPYGLRVLTKVLLTFSIIFPVLTFLLLVTHGRYSHFVINGTQVTYDEFWRRGGFLTFFLIVVYCAVLVYGLLRASHWSRPMLLLPFAISPIWIVIHPHAAHTLYNCLSSLFAIAFLVWYLFFRQTVRGYYTKTNNPVI